MQKNATTGPETSSLRGFAVQVNPRRFVFNLVIVNRY